MELLHLAKVQQHLSGYPIHLAYRHQLSSTKVYRMERCIVLKLKNESAIDLIFQYVYCLNTSKFLITICILHSLRLGVYI